MGGSEQREEEKKDEDIAIEEYDGYFKKLLGGKVDSKVIIELREGIRQDEEEDISRKEKRVAIRKREG